MDIETMLKESAITRDVAEISHTPKPPTNNQPISLEGHPKGSGYELRIRAAAGYSEQQQDAAWLIGHIVGSGSYYKTTESYGPLQDGEEQSIIITIGGPDPDQPVAKSKAAPSQLSQPSKENVNGSLPIR